MVYTLTNNTVIIRDADGANIPEDPANTDYQAYKVWIAAGNTPNPAPVSPAPTPSCSLWQLQAVLTAAQWTAAQAAVAALNNPAVSAFFAHGTNVIPATSTTLQSLAATIGLTNAQLAAAVSQASTISIP